VIGLGMKSLVVPLLGLGLSLALATFLDQRRVVRLLSILALVAAIAIAGSGALFVLDFLQLRPGVAAELKAGVDRAAVSALMVATVCFPVALGIAIGGWKASRGTTFRDSKKKKEVGLVISTPPNPKESAT
jgi:hypothetical protein